MTQSPLLGTPEEVEQFAWDAVESIERQYGAARTQTERHLLALAYLRGSRDKEAALRRLLMGGVK